MLLTAFLSITRPMKESSLNIATTYSLGSTTLSHCTHFPIAKRNDSVPHLLTPLFVALSHPLCPGEPQNRGVNCCCAPIRTCPGGPDRIKDYRMEEGR
ncbi:hypothetical protein CEXT_217551 [Caerostris extrusa]|uniref:Uncharacterized protein n=1 Tax=Caerostris extrusa TaxID=172846 RepID=A0AAV4VQ38_CAEEX|nr:hypothetical protein CEXT_217551 [Caerostris extrusa]